MMEGAAEPSATTWRELAVARSLDSARNRAEHRVQRFLDAALELMNDSASGKEFTVQEVVERSGQSLRSFYQYFGGKHELLLALFEESVRRTADLLSDKITDVDDPLERLHVFVVEYYRLCGTRAVNTSPKGDRPPGGQVVAEFAQQLLTSHPAEAARAFAPLAALFGSLVDGAAEAGAARPGLAHGPISGILLAAIMFNAFWATIGGFAVQPTTGDPAEALWDLILHGVGSPG